MLSVHFQGKPFNITVIHVYALTVMLKKLKLDCSMRTFKIFQNTQNRCLLLNRGLECKSKKSRASWSIKLIWPWSTKWSRAKTNRVLPREHTGHSKHPLPTTQEKTQHMGINRWSILKSDWLYSLQPGWRSSVQSQEMRPGADCGSDHELLIAKLRLKLKKVRKTTRPFSYVLNQSPYNYTVDMTNRFKGLDLIERVPEELWIEVCDIVWEAVIKNFSKKKKSKKKKWLSEEALQIAEKGREAKGKEEKERYTHVNAEFQRIT